MSAAVSVTPSAAMDPGAKTTLPALWTEALALILMLSVALAVEAWKTMSPVWPAPPTVTLPRSMAGTATPELVIWLASRMRPVPALSRLLPRSIAGDVESLQTVRLMSPPLVSIESPCQLMRPSESETLTPARWSYAARRLTSSGPPVDWIDPNKKLRS